MPRTDNADKFGDDRSLTKRRRAAEILDTSVSTLKRLEREGRLTPRRVGLRDIAYPTWQVRAIAEGKR